MTLYMFGYFLTSLLLYHNKMDVYLELQTKCHKSDNPHPLHDLCDVIYERCLSGIDTTNVSLNCKLLEYDKYISVVAEPVRALGNQ